MTDIIEQPTGQEIDRHYSALMDSVNLINAGKPEGMEDEEWADTVARNVEHCKIMLEKDFWTTQDLSPVRAVV